METYEYWFTQITIPIILIISYFIFGMFYLVVSIYLLTTLVAVVHQIQLLRKELRGRGGKK